MSYCRWSSDNWTCDVYVYENMMGMFVTHVAGNRVVGEVPREDFQLLLNGKTDEFMKQHEAQMAYLKTAARAPITLPHAGESFDDPTLADLRERLRYLQKLGYNVPAFVFDTIDAEINDQRTD